MTDSANALLYYERKSYFCDLEMDISPDSWIKARHDHVRRTFGKVEKFSHKAAYKYRNNSIIRIF